MSTMTTSTLVKASPGLHFKAHHRISQTVTCTPCRLYFSITAQQTWSLLRLSTSNILQRDSKTRRNFSAYCSDETETINVSSESSSGTRKNWILGFWFSFILPFFTNKFGPLLKIEKEVEKTLHRAEGLVVAVEKAAGEVEKAVEHIAEDIPDGTKLKSALTAVEHLAEATVENAHKMEHLIEEVEEMEEKMESFVESALEKSKEADGKSNDHKSRACEEGCISLLLSTWSPFLW